MPRAKQRRGLLPTTPIGMPFRPPPTLQIPESLTAIGDKTGKRYFRFGEDGQETVDIRGSGKTTMVGGTVQAAGGLTALVSGYSGYNSSSNDPYAARRQRARLRAQTNLGQIQQLQGARRDFGNLQDVAKRRTLQASEDTAYSRLGVAAPENVDVPLGSAANFQSPLARESIRSQEQLLSEQFNEQNAIQSAQDEIADLNDQQGSSRDMISGIARPSLSRGSRRSGAIAPAAPSRRATMGGQQQPMGKGGSVEYVMDPETGKSYEVDPEQAPEFRKQLQERNAKRRGNVLYEDPFNPGQSEEVSPGEAEIRKKRDDARATQEYQKRYEPTDSPYANLSRSELMGYAADGAIEPQDIVQEFRARGLQEGEIVVLMKAIKAEQKKKAGTAIKYPQGFGDQEETPKRAFFWNYGQ